MDLHLRNIALVKNGLITLTPTTLILGIEILFMKEKLIEKYLLRIITVSVLVTISSSVTIKDINNE